MKWKSFESPQDPVMRDFARLPRRVYHGDPWYIPVPPARLISGFDPEHNPFYGYGSSRQFVVYEGTHPVARCAAGINPRMDRDGERVGTIGFFEAVPNPAISRDLIGRALDWLHNADVTRIYGPMNFSIWSGYRFKTEGFDLPPYLGEPYNKPYYGDHFQVAGFFPAGTWHSSVIDTRTQGTALQRKQEKFAHRLLASREAGYEFSSHSSPGRHQELLREIYELVMESYSGFFGFYRLSWHEFSAIYGDLGRLIRRNQLLLTRRNQRLAGFLIQHWDWADLLRTCHGRPGLLTALRLRFGPTPQRWIMSIGGVRRASMTDHSGVSSAVVHLAIKEALAQGATELIYSLMSETNRSNSFGAGLVARRTTYTLYESKL